MSLFANSFPFPGWFCSLLLPLPPSLSFFFSFCMSGNLLLGVLHCEFYLFGYWMFLYCCIYSWTLFWDMQLNYLETVWFSWGLLFNNTFLSSLWIRRFSTLAETYTIVLCDLSDCSLCPFWFVPPLTLGCSSCIFWSVLSWGLMAGVCPFQIARAFYSCSSVLFGTLRLNFSHPGNSAISAYIDYQTPPGLHLLARLSGNCPDMNLEQSQGLTLFISHLSMSTVLCLLVYSVWNSVFHVFII